MLNVRVRQATQRVTHYLLFCKWRAKLELFASAHFGIKVAFGGGQAAALQEGQHAGEGDHFRTPILDHFRTPMSWIIFEHRVGHFRTHGGAILRHPWGGGPGGSESQVTLAF